MVEKSSSKDVFLYNVLIPTPICLDTTHSPILHYLPTILIFVDPVNVSLKNPRILQ